MNRIFNVKKKIDTIGLHLFLMVTLSSFIALCILYPFLPGEYDGLALPLSIMAQTFGFIGLLLVPIGLLWLTYEWRKQARIRRRLPTTAQRYYYANVSVIIASIVVMPILLVAYASVGLSFGLMMLSLWLFIAIKLASKLKTVKNKENDDFNPVPLYLIFLPIAALLVQYFLATPVAEFSRNHAISMSTKLIEDIEEYNNRNGCYPNTLLAVWNDYEPMVVGIEKFQYAPVGKAYNLFFEQPRFILDNIGTREFVVYNNLDEQTMISHASWILLLSPEKLQSAQGWYAIHNGSSRHWKYFWFD